MEKRISREDMVADIVQTIAKRSTCNRRHVGALFTLEGRILSTGYNGAPSGLPHCLDSGCTLGPDGGCVRSAHAELNAVAFAARHGISLAGSDLWCTMTPCPTCAMLLINSGVARVFCLEEYRLKEGINLLASAKVQVWIMEKQQSLKIGSPRTFIMNGAYGAK